MLGEQFVVARPLAIGNVRFCGEPVALVVATSREIAEDACGLIELELEGLTAVDYRTAAADVENVVHSAFAAEITVAAEFARGRTDVGLRSNDVFQNLTPDGRRERQTSG